MNRNSQPVAKPFKLDWKKFAIIGLVLVVAGYQWYTENGSADKPVAATSSESGSEYNYKIEFDGDKSSEASSTKAESKGSYLQPSGRSNLESPAGLIYTSGRDEHRSDHVLRHAEDMPNRDGTHGVFDANGDDVFRLIDEAYELVKQKSRQVKTNPDDGGKTEYVIDMKRRVGYKGGKTGNRQNKPPLYKVKLILGDNRVITAYPY